jgi:quinol monooxygenase YgiN
VTDWPPVDPTDADAVADHRDELVVAVRDHAGTIAYALARLQGGDYGRVDFETDRGEWTVKYEGGDLEYLRFDPSTGTEIYVISTKQRPEPNALATAMADYDAFVAAYNEYVASVEGTLDDVSTSFPEPRSTRTAVEERRRVLDRVEEVCDEIAGQLHRLDGGDYGTFDARIGGMRWELNWDRDGVSYLRIGGSDGVYLISQYAAPEASDIRRYVPQFEAFVDAYNEEVRELEATLGTVEL